MDEAASDYHHGDQDVSAQAASYRLFNVLAKWGSLTLAVLIVMLTLWFCIGASFLAGPHSAALVLWRASAGLLRIEARPKSSPEENDRGHRRRDQGAPRR